MQLGPGGRPPQLKDSNGTRARPETAELEGGANSPSTCHMWREDKVATKRTVPPRVPQSSFSTASSSPAPRPPLGLQGPFQAAAQMPKTLMTPGGGCGQLSQEATVPHPTDGHGHRWYLALTSVFRAGRGDSQQGGTPSPISKLYSWARDSPDVLAASVFSLPVSGTFC